MADEKAKANPLSTIVTLVALIVGGWYYFGGGFEQQVDRNMDNIYDKVASDAVEQYGIAKRNGTPIDRCVHAGLVAASFLQAKNEPYYKRWKDTEAEDCKAARVPR